MVDNANSAAENVSFLHRVRGEDHGSIFLIFAVLEDVPKLSPGVRVKASGGLVQEDYLWG